MAPIDEGTVDGLKDMVQKLERRVRNLEDKLEGREKTSQSVADQMRMILIGPPGAGTCSNLLRCFSTDSIAQAKAPKLRT